MSYLLVSDLHCHTWSSYSKTNPDGVNSRLRIILDELRAATLQAAKIGISKMVIAGDLFHVRGSIDPEVLNPVQEVIAEIMERGFDIYAIPGNHDLKSRDTTELGSSIQTLSQMFSAEGSVRIINGPTFFPDMKLAFIPWASEPTALLAQISDLAVNINDTSEYDLIIHAGIDGVLPGLDGHGVEAAQLKKFGFRNVFAGHYHNRKQVMPGIWSIGALTHQNWGDIDTKSGYMFVHDDGRIDEFDDKAPKFVDVSAMSTTDAELAAKGNYVRFRGPPLTADQAKDIRQLFEKAGALGIAIQSPRATASARAVTAAQTKAMTVDDSVLAYVDAKTDIPAMIDKLEVKRRCVDILNAVRAVEA